MIIDFTISNYRSIREPQTISFEATGDNHLENYFVVEKGKYRILKLATIYGPNASGKSNVIRAFSMLRTLLLRPCADKTAEIRYDKFALDEKAKQQDSEMTVNFICDEKKYHYEAVFNNKFVRSELLKCQPFDKSRPHVVFERSTDENSLMAKVKWGSNYPMASVARAMNVNLLHNRTVFGAFQMSNVDIPWMKAILDWLQEYMLPAVSTGDQKLFFFTSTMLDERQDYKRMVEALLNKADVGINGFEIQEEKQEISDRVLEMIMDDESIPEKAKEKIKSDPYSHSMQVRMRHTTSRDTSFIDYSQESNGTKRYYELSGVMLKLIKESHFVAIDELECRLHPDLYKHFIVTYLTNAKDSQMVFTTHLREFLADKNLFRNDAIWFTDKNVDGETELYSLADFDENELKKQNIFDAYRAGRFGAIPHLGDTYIE